MENKLNEQSRIEKSTSCSCCNGLQHDQGSNEISRRKFVQVTGTSVIGSVALSGLSWTALAATPTEDKNLTRRKSLVVKPIFTYATPARREQASWRTWGGIQTEKDAEQERQRIQGELKTLQSRADFPVEFLPIASVQTEPDLSKIQDLETADLFLIYAAGGSANIFDSLNKMGKNRIIFCRHKSGPVYLWYEIVSPTFLRKRTDKLAVSGINDYDVVIDSQDELLWRLRALCGLKNTLTSRIIAIGGPGGWGQPKAPEFARNIFKLDMQTVTYEDLDKLVDEAKADKSLVSRAKNRANEYLKDKTIKLETKREFVDNCFILEEVFTRLMDKFECKAITISGCMRTIMPVAETSACLTLSLINDAGYLAFCESDFVCVPSGILLANISGKPVFLNDPTYPHDGLITLAHCTAPRRMDGKKLEPARLLTHFESDYGAAPKVEMLIGQPVTNILPDFSFERHVGLLGKIVDNPFLDICRSQIDISYTCDNLLLAEEMPGFHWITGYGDYLKEYGYAMKKIGIDFKTLV
jgi:hypothetical protein